MGYVSTHARLALFVVLSFNTRSAVTSEQCKACQVNLPLLKDAALESVLADVSEDIDHAEACKKLAPTSVAGCLAMGNKAGKEGFLGMIHFCQKACEGIDVEKLDLAKAPEGDGTRTSWRRTCGLISFFGAMVFLVLTLAFVIRAEESKAVSSKRVSKSRGSKGKKIAKESHDRDAGVTVSHPKRRAGLWFGFLWAGFVVFGLGGTFVVEEMLIYSSETSIYGLPIVALDVILGVFRGLLLAGVIFSPAILYIFRVVAFPKRPSSAEVKKDA
ncbi:hypothetical protein CYMTET_45029 [Cymbomonas tetramitiformis]|uniref:Transmembrane protein n=1 Tax=Cymbomonas tetramitiformis TaxID=36881 RepID=A0AAE0C083_9CHLO|nr:hypothetical protein CYMTET_45029 [Cymbomonas tetramitiformis]